MFPNYHHQEYREQQSSDQQVDQGAFVYKASGSKTPTQQKSRSRFGPLSLSLQSAHSLSSAFGASNDSASSSSPSSAPSPVTTSYTLDPLASANNYLIENTNQTYNANLARRSTLPNALRDRGLIASNLSSTSQRPLVFQATLRASNMNNAGSSHFQVRGTEPTQGFQCPNCSKSFARDDLLRRHLTREARAQAQPVIDRQKSCHECARSKSRCDLEVPSCGRCRSRGKTCNYGARSGNPNVRRGMRETQEPSIKRSSNDSITQPPNWHENTSFGAQSQWTTSQGYPQQGSGEENLSFDESESDDSRQWQDQFQHYRMARAGSTSSASTNASYDPHQSLQPSLESGFTQSFNPSSRSESPAHFSNTVTDAQGTLHLGRGFSGSSAKNSINTNVTSRNEDDEATPITRTIASSLLEGGPSTMGPPHLTPGRLREQAIPFTHSYWDPTVEGMSSFKQPRTGETQRPQPPQLLTGARMPQPATRPGVEPISARPLFSAQLDLSGWLEEPVVPSPLYRMGPSLSALIPSTPTKTSIPGSDAHWTGNSSNAEALRSALNANHMPLPAIDTVMDQHNKTTDTENQVAARMWWAHASDMPQNDVQSQGVAQACAGHFTVYPALMVLPEATSPVPPLFHRPWLASSRLHTPASLARARILLAGYHVKLPASEAMIWEMIANEANTLIASFDRHVNASDLDVFSSTAALWFLVILLLMSSDPSNAAGSVSDALVDSSLIGLSQYSRLLSQRVHACEERKRTQGHTPSFLEWGFEETMKRTLFASYSLLVLQRFRETSTVVQSQLAGIDLILNVSLPATAMEFEAGNELEWQASQSVKITEPSVVDGITVPITIGHLLNARKGENAGSQQSTKEINSYFDRHDDFTNVCLSVAFALDRNIP